MLPIVIVGSGLAGYTVARELRKQDQTAPIMLITADDGRVYAKPMLSNALAAGKTAAALATADGDEMRRQLHIDIRPDSRVVAIDSLAHTLTVGGASIGYSKLVLALGADPITPHLAGNGAPEVLTVNDLTDYGRFRAAIHPGQRVAILGAGLIGCEFANDLCGAGYPVTLIHPAATPLNRLLPETAGHAMREALAAAGVDWQGGETATAVDRTPGGYRLTLRSGAFLEAAAVLSAIGLKPRIALAAAAGMRTHRGIVVDRYLQTSAADVYAVGDCAEVEGRVLPFVLPLMHGARALARTLAGEATAVSYPAMPVVVKTPACPVVVAPPEAGTAGEWQVNGEEGGVRALFYDSARQLRGFALTGAAAAQKQTLMRQLPPLMT